MSHATRKLIAVLMLLWLPLSSASALASVVAMQSQPAGCHAASMHGMQHHDMAGHQHHQAPSAHDQQSNSCTSCGACHLACSACLTTSVDGLPVLQPSAQEYAPHFVAYKSVSAVPLLPPPLARA